MFFLSPSMLFLFYYGCKNIVRTYYISNKIKRAIIKFYQHNVRKNSFRNIPICFRILFLNINIISKFICEQYLMNWCTKIFRYTWSISNSLLTVIKSISMLHEKKVNYSKLNDKLWYSNNIYPKVIYSKITQKFKKKITTIHRSHKKISG